MEPVKDLLSVETETSPLDESLICSSAFFTGVIGDCYEKDLGSLVMTFSASLYAVRSGRRKRILVNAAKRFNLKTASDKLLTLNVILRIAERLSNRRTKMAGYTFFEFARAPFHLSHFLWASIYFICVKTDLVKNYLATICVEVEKHFRTRLALRHMFPPVVLY